MQIQPGARVGPYEIVAPIGAGGMGEVWRARDPRIGRDVALKFVPAAMRSPDRLHRFEQEARTAGSLNHPNLVTVFDFGGDEDMPYVVMELLDGETLRAKLDGGRIPIRKSVEYASQIASGLAAAHEHGIVHRDLKPENIIVTSDGRVKIVDFGLAKPSARTEGTDIATQHRDTAPGTVLGTAGYMSPEQVRGHNVDHRSDIFSFGAILYEMLSGRRAFKGESSVETMNSILKDDPPELSSADAPIPQPLESVVRHCLEKNPGERFQSARDLAFDLQRSPSMQSGSAIALPSKRALLPVVVVIALIAAAVAGWLTGHRSATVAPSATRPLYTFSQLTLHSHESEPVIAPDGKTFAFTSDITGIEDIYVQRVDGKNAINLTKDSGARNYTPAFSPDGSQIAFRSDRSGGGIFIMGSTGESVRRLTDFGFNPAWSPDGRQIAFGTDTIHSNPGGRGGRSTLWVIDVRSGAKRQITKSDAVQPAWSPHGNRIACWGLVNEGGQRDILTIDPRAADAEKTIVRITNDRQIDWSPAWSPDGKYLYFSSDRDGSMNLWRIPVDETSGRATGAIEAMTVPSRFAGHFSISRDGDIAFDSVEHTDTLWRVPLRASGEATPLLTGALDIYASDVSPDGRWIAFSNYGAQEDIWIMRSDGTDIRQLTNDPERDRAPAFSLDGNVLYFYAERTGRYEMWSVRPDGSDLKQLSHFTGPSIWYPHPMPDGKGLYANNGQMTAILPFDADGTITRMEPLPAMAGGAAMRWPRFSSDGSMIIASVDQPVSMAGIWLYTVATRKYERLTESGEEPHWLPGPAAIALFHDKGKAFTIDVRSKQVRPFAAPAIHQFGRFAVSPDGQFAVVDEKTQSSIVWLMKPAASRP